MDKLYNLAFDFMLDIFLSKNNENREDALGTQMTGEGGVFMNNEDQMDWEDDVNDPLEKAMLKMNFSDYGSPFPAKFKKMHSNDDDDDDDDDGVSGLSTRSNSPISSVFLGDDIKPIGRRCSNESFIKGSRSVCNLSSDDENVTSYGSDLFSRGERKQKKCELTAPNLARCLSKFDDFEATLLQLSDKYHFGNNDILNIAVTNHNTFELDGEIVRLRPKVKLCSAYSDDEGCQDPDSCDSVHICPEYAAGNCKDKYCILVHEWNTNHNKGIFLQYNLDHFPVQKFGLLFKTVILGSVSGKELKLCDNFNDNNCTTQDCPYLHLCLKYLARRCLRSSCSLNHTLNRQSRSILKSHGIDLNECPQDILNQISNSPSIKESIDAYITQDDNEREYSQRTMWSHDLIGNVKVSEICYNSVESLCQYEESGCWRLHSTFHFYWQIKANLGEKNLWVNLTEEQVLELEKAYCDPSSSEVDVPVLDPMATNDSDKGLLHILKGRSKWQANFDTMKINLLDNNDSLELRRICTEKTANVTPEPCIFKWYFLDKNNKWIEYGKIDSTGVEKLKCDATSDFIEREYIRNPIGKFTFKNQYFSYLLDLGKMTQMNQETNVVRDVRRRPRPHYKEKTDLPPEWESMQVEDLYRGMTLQPSSNEYKTIDNLVKTRASDNQYNIHKIERVQNPSIFRTFQNKIKEMKTSYKSNTTIDIPQLYQGPGPDIQTNQETNVVRDVGKPRPHYKVKTDLPHEWEAMQVEDLYKRVTLQPSSNEYKTIDNLVKTRANGNQYNILKIERVQNPYIFRAFQNKVKELKTIYKSNTTIDIRQLFHGTRPDIVPKICCENFDWRLHGTSTGQRYGRGTYFARDSSYSYEYAVEDASGHRLMFVAKVIVGTVTKGNSGITSPPINAQYYLPYDSTVDDVSNPSIIVKYDKQEYYPEYIVTFG